MSTSSSVVSRKLAPKYEKATAQRLRVGIDAKSFFNGPVSTKIVLQNLVPALITAYPQNDWILFLDKKDEHRKFPLKSKNIQLHYIWGEVNMLSNLFLLSNKLKTLQVDVMVYQTFPAFKQNVPSISFIHDVLFRDYPEFFSWKERLYFKPMQWLARHRSDRLIATTEFVAGDLLKFGYAKSRANIDIVPLAVNSEFVPIEEHDPVKLLEVRRKFNLPEQYLLIVGRLNVRKNIESALRSLGMMRNKEIKLVIVGKPDWKTPDLKKILSDPKISQRTILTGSMTDEELRMAYAMAKVFLFPSYAEGFGLPTLEAMASGVPVIVSRTTAMPEVCGDAPMYIDPRRPETIARAVDELVEDDILYEVHRRRGLVQAKKFNWARAADAFMEAIRNAAHQQAKVVHI